MNDATNLDRYTRTAARAAATVIETYSTSFALACRLLGPRVRAHVRNIYALVRVADEIVDGPAAESGADAEQVRATLDALEHDTLHAMRTGFSANLIVHAFAATARATGIEEQLVTPFFASMRTDVDIAQHDAESHDAYVYGSAEVVGLMCLQVFVGAGAPQTRPSAVLTDGARRLGAAFQDVNFLRDLADDADRLGRDYLDARTPTARLAALDRIDADLAAAAASLASLPADCRRAVIAAHDLFAELSARLRASDDPAVRVRVPDAVKVLIAARAAAGRPPRRGAPPTRIAGESTDAALRTGDAAA